jgi:hypothetical protein
MLRKSIPMLVILVLLLSACDLHISLPLTIKTGPLVTDEINVPLPADTSSAVDLTLSFGAGTLKLNPGSSTLVSGTAEYNISDFKPEVTISDSSVHIEQGDWRLTGIPDVTKVKQMDARQYPRSDTAVRL